MSATCHLGRWLDLEARAPDDASYLPMLRAEIERVARSANLDPLQIKPDRKPPASAPRGPTRLARACRGPTRSRRCRTSPPSSASRRSAPALSLSKGHGLP